MRHATDAYSASSMSLSGRTKLGTRTARVSRSNRSTPRPDPGLGVAAPGVRSVTIGRPPRADQMADNGGQVKRARRRPTMPEPERAHQRPRSSTTAGDFERKPGRHPGDARMLDAASRPGRPHNLRNSGGAAGG